MLSRMNSFGDAPTTEFGGQLIGGEPMHGECQARLLTMGDGVMLVHMTMEPGYENEGHSHPDHESVGFIVEGSLDMTVGGEAKTLEAGDTWYHPAGVPHSCIANERCVALEFHAPLRSDVLELFGIEVIRESL